MVCIWYLTVILLGWDTETDLEESWKVKGLQFTFISFCRSTSASTRLKKPGWAPIGNPYGTKVSAWNLVWFKYTLCCLSQLKKVLVGPLMAPMVCSIGRWPYLSGFLVWGLCGSGNIGSRSLDRPLGTVLWMKTGHSPKRSLRWVVHCKCKRWSGAFDFLAGGASNFEHWLKGWGWRCHQWKES